MKGSKLNAGKVGKLALWGLGLVALANAGAGGVSTGAGPSLADVQRLAKVGYREIRLDDRTHDIGFAEDNVVYTTHYIVYKTGGKITSLDLNNMKSLVRKPNLSRFIGIGGRLFGHTDKKLGIIDLEKNTSKTVALLQGGEFDTGDKFRGSNISLYPMSGNRIYYNLGLVTEKRAGCNVYGVLKLDNYDNLWKRNTCLDRSLLSQVEVFRGEDYAYGFKEYIFTPPGSNLGDMLVYNVSDGRLVKEDINYKNLVEYLTKVQNYSNKTLHYGASNYFSDSLCKSVDQEKYKVVKEYIAQKVQKKIYVVDMQSCKNSFFTVLWSPTPDKNEYGGAILDASKNDYQLSIIGGE